MRRPGPDLRRSRERDAIASVVLELHSLGNAVAALTSLAPPGRGRELARSSLHRLDAAIRHLRRAEAQRRAAEAEQVAQLHDLEQTNSNQIDLIAAIGHDLRSPLAVVLAYLEILGEADHGPDERHLALLRANAAGHQARVLLDDILAAAAAEDRSRQVHPRSLDLATWVPAFLLAVPGGDRVEVAVEPGVTVEFDPVHLGQVLGNLIGNAFRHGSEPVGLTVLRSGTAAEIQVTDAGPGPTPQAAAHLFERHAPAPTDAPRPEGSHGLGLYLADRLTRANGASLEHEASTSEQAHHFTIRIPGLERPEPPAGGSTEAPEPHRLA